MEKTKSRSVTMISPDLTKRWAAIEPLAPGQIAGKGALVVAQGGRGGGGGILNGSRGPIWGGVPGTGTRPERIGGDGEVATAGGSTETKAAINDGGKEKDNPLLGSLKEKIAAARRNKRACYRAVVLLLGRQTQIKGSGIDVQEPGRPPDAGLSEIMRIADLDTPALVIDIDIMERNLQRAADYAREHKLRLRPHTKTHKIPALARNCRSRWARWGLPWPKRPKPR